MGNVDAFDDALHAAAEGQQSGRSASSALPGRCKRFSAVFQCVRGQAQRMDHFARPLVRRDGNHPHDLCEWFDQRVFIGTLETSETGSDDRAMR